MRAIAILAIFLAIAGCDVTPSLTGTWDGEMPEGQTIKTPKGEVRPNLVLELKADHHFHATVSVAALDGRWERDGQKLILHPEKATINGQDVAEMRKKLEPMMNLLPPEEKATLDAYAPTKPWTLEIRDDGRSLYLPSRGDGIAAFTFHKSS